MLTSVIMHSFLLPVIGALVLLYRSYTGARVERSGGDSEGIRGAPFSEDHSNVLS